MDIFTSQPSISHEERNEDFELKLQGKGGILFYFSVLYGGLISFCTSCRLQFSLIRIDLFRERKERAAG